MKKIKSIGFEGLNGSGKGTRISIFTKYFRSKNTQYAVLRGDGLRFGTGSKEYDSDSSWWRENVAYLLDKKENPLEKLNLQYQRLSRERLVTERALMNSLSDGETGVILFDRSFISRYFTMQQYIPGITLENALKAVNPKTGKVVKPIIPDVTVVFKLSKQTLLERLEYGSGEGQNIRKRIVTEHYDLYMALVQEMESRGDVIIIDGEKDLAQIDKIMMEISNNE